MNITFSGMPLSETPPHVRAIFTRVFPLCFVLMGIALMVMGGRNISQAQSSKKWPTAQGQVISSQVKQVYTGKGHSPDPQYRNTARDRRSDYAYHARIAYRYNTSGRTYQGSRITYGDHGARAPRHAQQQVQKYPVGRAVTVYYSPQNPQESLLEPGAKPHMWQQFWAGFLFMIVGGLLALFIPWLWKRFSHE